MTNDIMSEVAVEVSCILQKFPVSFKKKIPQDFFEFINSVKSTTYTFIYDESKLLNEQNIKSETKGVIAYIYENFCCSDEEKKQYQKKCREFEYQKQENARNKYNVDNIFKNTKYTVNTTSNINTENKVLDNSNINEVSKEKNLGIVEYKKETWYHKIIKKFLELFI